MDERTFSETLNNNLPENTNKGPVNETCIQVLKIIPPFRREHVQSFERLNEAYSQCVQSILKHFPDPIQNRTTISRTFTTGSDNKRLHALTIVSPPEAKQYFDTFKAEGIQLMGKTIFPMGFVPKQQRLRNFYPRKLKIKINNLPLICSDVELKSYLRLPPGVTHAPESKRETFDLGDGKVVHTGKATLEVIVPNEQHEEKLRQWSYDNAMSEGIDWNGVNVTFHAPSLHACEICKSMERRFIGHHKDWCLNALKNSSDPQKSVDAGDAENLPEQNPGSSSDSSDIENTHPNLEIEEAPTATTSIVETTSEVLVEAALNDFQPPVPPGFSVNLHNTPSKHRRELSTIDNNKMNFYRRDMSPFNFVPLKSKNRPNSKTRRKQRQKHNLRQLHPDRDDPGQL